MNHYPVDSTIGFPNIYPLDSDLFGGYHYPFLEKPGPSDKNMLERFRRTFFNVPLFDVNDQNFECQHISLCWRSTPFE